MSMFSNFIGRVLILGGGSDQKKLVEVFIAKHFYTIIIDYLENPPAKSIAQKHYRVSTYDRKKVLKVAMLEKVDFVTTISTDQPLLVAAWVSEQLGLRFHINYQQALNITNKRFMKNVLSHHSIPTARHVILENMSELPNLKSLKYPLIIKPVDSSGSRGVFVINSQSELKSYYDLSRNNSKTNTVIAEEFIKGEEVSVDAFVINKQTTIISVTDGFTWRFHKGVPLYVQNVFPSTITEKAVRNIENISQKIATAFNLTNSPLFVQLIVKGDEVFVIECSARIAGGSKPYFIPLVSGVNIVEEFVDMIIVGQTKNIQKVISEETCILSHIYSFGGVFMGFKKTKELQCKKSIKKIITYQSNGSTVEYPTNGSSRIGAFIVQDKEHVNAINTVQYVDDHLIALNEMGEDIMIHGIYKNQF